MINSKRNPLMMLSSVLVPIGYVLFFGLSGCVPSPNVSSPKEKSFLLKQDPVVSGEFGEVSQLTSLSKVFVIRPQNEEDVDISTISLEGSSFEIVGTTGCEKVLKPRESCFIRVSFNGKKQSQTGLKQGTLVAGNLRIPLSGTYTPIQDQGVEIISNSSLLTESFDVECFKGSCYLALEYKNPNLIPVSPSALEVPPGYIVGYNSCGRPINPQKSCFIRLKIQESVGDLSQSSIKLNINGQAVNQEVRVLKEEDNIAPAFSFEITNAFEESPVIVLRDAQAMLSASISENRIEKGFFYSLSSDLFCSSSTWTPHSSSSLSLNIPLTLNTVNNFSLKMKDAVGNESSCVEVVLKQASIQSCSIVNGSGEQDFNVSTGTWGPCLVKTCNENYYISTSNNSCVLNNSIACENQEDDYGNVIGFGFLNSSSSGLNCQIKSCVSSAYEVVAGSCECVNEGGCFVDPVTVNASLTAINASLSLSNQAPVSLVSEQSMVDYTQINSISNSLKKFDPNNSLVTFSSKITKSQWQSQAQELKRMVDLYYHTCLNLASIASSSPAMGNTCSLSDRLNAVYSLLNNYFPFYGDVAVTLNSTSTTFVDYNVLNTVINSFNNKTNKENLISNFVAADTISATSINAKLLNLRLNIKSKLEASLPNYQANPYLGASVVGMTTSETSKNLTASFKVEDSSASSLSLSSLATGVVCVNNEYCKYTPTTHLLVDTAVVTVNKVVSGSSSSSVIKLKVASADAIAPNSSADYGCYDAAVGSASTRNIWACQGANNRSCTYFCYLSGEGGGCNASVSVVFNSYYNASGKYQYKSFAYTSGDLRSGCGGNYTHALAVTYVKQSYSLGL